MLRYEALCLARLEKCNLLYKKRVMKAQSARARADALDLDTKSKNKPVAMGI